MNELLLIGRKRSSGELQLGGPVGIEGRAVSRHLDSTGRRRREFLVQDAVLRLPGDHSHSTLGAGGSHAWHADEAPVCAHLRAQVERAVPYARTVEVTEVVGAFWLNDV